MSTETEDFFLEDEEISEEDKLIIEQAQEVSLTTQTHGWHIIKKEIENNCTDYEQIIINSKSMEETFGASKTLSGMKFVLNMVDEFIKDGEEAIERNKRK